MSERCHWDRYIQWQVLPPLALYRRTLYIVHTRCDSIYIVEHVTRDLLIHIYIPTTTGQALASGFCPSVFSFFMSFALFRALYDTTA